MSIHFRHRPICEVCGSLESKMIRSASYADPSVWNFLETYYEGRIDRTVCNDVHYEIRQCDVCGFLWQAYILDDEGMKKLYSEWIPPEGSRKKREHGGVELFSGYAREILTVSALIHKQDESIRVLDHGMGWGYWCLMARAFGFESYGTEISEERCWYAEKNGIQVVDASALSKDYFDFINAEQSFEHIPDPRKNMLLLTAALKPGGVLRIAVPNAGRALSTLHNSKWKANKDPFHPLEHINCFTHKSLRRLGQEAGLSVVIPPMFPTVVMSPSILLRQMMGNFYYRFWGTKMYFRKPCL